MSGGELDILVVYDRPLDYPESVVVRRWVLTDPREHYLFESLDAAREFLTQRALVVLPRFDNDDSKIVETWI